ncbi:MAG: four helix bundle protein [Bacteroidota bacterium]
MIFLIWGINKKMATIERFEDIIAWQKARELSKKVYEITKTGGLSKDFKLKDQMTDSSGSIMDNIAEGFERGGNGEFIQFLGYAKGSSGELRSQLYRILDQEYITKAKFNELYTLADDIGKMIKGLIDYLNSTDIRGQKYKQEKIKKKH